MYLETSSDENSTVLAMRAFVQVNCWSSRPIIWNSRTGFPDFSAAACASASDLCHFTLPGSTVGLSFSAAVFAGTGGWGTACGAPMATTQQAARISFARLMEPSACGRRCAFQQSITEAKRDVGHGVVTSSRGTVLLS